MRLLETNICEVLVEIPIPHDDGRHMFIQLQVPVKSS